MSYFKYRSADLCPEKGQHTDQPTDYIAAVKWAEQMLKTHVQEKCPTCGYWAIWRRKKAA